MIPEKITIKCPRDYGNQKVAAIKAIRELTNMGLKEAKDASEIIGDQQLSIGHRLYGPNAEPDAQMKFEMSIKAMESAGIEIADYAFRILKSLRELGAEAFRCGDDELAGEILQLVLAEKLRRAK